MSIAYSNSVVTKIRDEFQRERAAFAAQVDSLAGRALLVEWPAGMDLHQAARLARRKFLAAQHLVGWSPVSLGFNPAQRPEADSLAGLVVFVDGEIPIGKIRVVGNVDVGVV